MRREREFTLIELLVVLAVVSLVVGITLPFFAKRGADAAFAGATVELRQVLVAARSDSIASGREIAFAGDRDGYRIDGRHHALATAAGLSVEIRGGSRISFFPSGGSSGGRIVLRGDNRRREIEIEALTGHAILLP